MLLVIPILLFFSTSLSSASPNVTNFVESWQQINPLSSKNTAFYKSPDSQFASGFASEDKLFKNQFDSKTYESSYYIYKNQKISKSLLKTITAKDLSTSELLKDTGLFLTLLPTQLRLGPSSDEKSLMTIPMGTKLIPLSYKKGMVEVKYKNKKGYVQISDCISKFDFARAIYAYHPEQRKLQWFFVKKRTFDTIETHDHFKISMNQILGILPDNSKAIISQPDQSLPLWTTLKLETEVLNIWHKSRLDGHGIVFWKSNASTKTALNQKIHIDDLLKKEISFVSIHPKNPKKAVASANGLYITEDGEYWTEISSFKNFTGPVLYYNDFLIYAGNFRSIDSGKTFEQYIQIEKIASSISQQIGIIPRKMNVTQIKTIKPFKVEIDIEIGLGNRKIKMQSPVYSQEWKVTRI